MGDPSRRTCHARSPWGWASSRANVACASHVACARGDDGWGTVAAGRGGRACLRVAVRRRLGAAELGGVGCGGAVVMGVQSELGALMEWRWADGVALGVRDAGEMVLMLLGGMTAGSLQSRDEGAACLHVVVRRRLRAAALGICGARGHHGDGRTSEMLGVAAPSAEEG